MSLELPATYLDELSMVIFNQNFCQRAVSWSITRHKAGTVGRAYSDKKDAFQPYQIPESLRFSSKTDGR